MDQGTKVLLWSIALLIIFVLITLGEIVVLKRLGYDLLAHLQVTMRHGNKRKFFFEAFGVVAFILIQPLVLSWLLANISAHVSSILNQSVSRFEAFL